MKKAAASILSLALMLSLVACGGTESSSSQPQSTGGDSTSTAEPAGTNDDFNYGAEITVVTRENGSGTRGAFIELMGIEVKDGDGNKVDMTSLEAIENNSTSVMMTTISGDVNGIGYISLGSLNDTVKALAIDGAAPTVENVKNGSYPVSRPFNIATKGDMNEVTEDFVSFILSDEGQAVVEDRGYISEGSTGAFETSNAAGKIVVAGSSSVTPVMEKLIEAYLAINTNAEIELQESDSSIGMQSTIDGICDIGMASRELKESELAELTPLVIAIDGIAVIVNNENPVDGLTSEQVRTIYTSDEISWEEALAA